MRQMLESRACRATRTHRPTLIALAVGSVLAALVAAPAAFANSAALKAEFLPFADCPDQTAAVCVVATTTSGEFVIGHKTVPIEKPVLLQGGLGSAEYGAQPLIAPAEGETLSKSPQTVPGGLAGIAGLGGEVTATAELAGPPSSIIISKKNLVLFKGAAVTLPLKVKLSNEVLGEECYIGSDAEPIVLHLTTGETEPPAGKTPIRGSISPLEGLAKGKIKIIRKTKLVDNDFSVPGATGCGGSLSSLIDPILDLDVGLPSSPGESSVIMSGSLEETAAEFAVKYLPKVKKAKK